jgi:hypothetical protein
MENKDCSITGEIIGTMLVGGTPEHCIPPKPIATRGCSLHFRPTAVLLPPADAGFPSAQTTPDGLQMEVMEGQQPAPKRDQAAEDQKIAASLGVTVERLNQFRAKVLQIKKKHPLWKDHRVERKAAEFFNIKLTK